MVVRRQADQRGAQERRPGEVEPAAPRLARRAAGLGLPRSAGQGREVDQRQGDVHGRAATRCTRRPVELQRRRCAATRAGGRPRRGRAAEGGHVERAREAHAPRQVEGGRPRLEPVEEPEPLLGEGERQVAVPGTRGDRVRGEARPASLPRAAATSSARSATDAARNSPSSRTSAPSSLLIRERSCRPRSEWPPSVEELVEAPTGAMPRRSSKRPASRCSRSLRGGLVDGAQGGAGFLWPVGSGGRIGLPPRLGTDSAWLRSNSAAAGTDTPARPPAAAARPRGGHASPPRLRPATAVPVSPGTPVRPRSGTAVAPVRSSSATPEKTLRGSREASASRASASSGRPASAGVPAPAAPSGG